MRSHLSRLGKQYVYHFTDRRNIEFIRTSGGLLPRSMIPGTYIPGGNQWSIDADNMFGMQNYVHLCFLNKHPMEYLARDEGRIDSVWLEINITVLDLPGVLYCAGVANQAGAEYLPADDAISVLDFDYMYNYHNFSVEENRNRHNLTQKYEILVPSLVPISMIRGI